MSISVKKGLMRNLKSKIRSLLLDLYGPSQVDSLFEDVWCLIERFMDQNPELSKSIPIVELLTERDSVLITYGDQFSSDDEHLLKVLSDFLKQNIGNVINRIHILPFFPYSSDDGYSIIDYKKVAPELGSWEDIANLETDYKLMFDLVLNHVSSHSLWFQKFLNGTPPYTNYFHVVKPGIDLSGVVRPRRTPVLTEYDTSDGRQQIWTTFSADQVDLNFANPKVLLEMIDIFLYYVAHGARIIRLDAIAYVWKKIGTGCIHLHQDHSIVKLLRAILDVCAPAVLLITETNVPHKENISYFGETITELNRSDEAQMVYQFPLAPLILHTFLTGNSTCLSKWAVDLKELQPGATFFNFTASHDGIGVRPAEGLLSSQEINALVQQTKAHGGVVSYGTNSEGVRIPYELNVTWYDALNDPVNPNNDQDIKRFLASQAIMLSLAGVPGIYIHSLFGTRNCGECTRETGRARSINREKFRLPNLQSDLDNPQDRKARVLAGYRDILTIRRSQPAFSPWASQRILNIDSKIFSLLRIPEYGTAILCLINVTALDIEIKFNPLEWDIPSDKEWVDLLNRQQLMPKSLTPIQLDPYQVRWLDVGVIRPN
jgi:glycosidase